MVGYGSKMAVVGCLWEEDPWPAGMPLAKDD